jgi:hypothetical protein
VLDALEEELPFQDIVFFRCTAIRRMQASPEKVLPSSVGCAHEIYVSYAIHIHAFPSIFLSRDRALGSGPEIVLLILLSSKWTDSTSQYQVKVEEQHPFF